MRTEHFRRRFSLLLGPKFLCKYHPLIGGEPQRFWPKVVSLCLGRPVGQTILQKKCRLVLKSYCLIYCCQDMKKILSHFINRIRFQRLRIFFCEHLKNFIFIFVFTLLTLIFIDCFINERY